MTKRVLLAAVGNVNHVSTWSGTPFHLLQVAKTTGVIHQGLSLEPIDSGRGLRRYLWNLAAVARGRGHGGYQFSAPCIEHYWAPCRGNLAGARVINCFQLFPPSVVANKTVELGFYIDQTLLQLFNAYGLGTGISKWMARDAMQRERAGYIRAPVIVTHSHWAAQSVVHDYGIAAEKVQVVVPGANLDIAAYNDWCNGRNAVSHRTPSPLRLVFVGKDAQRKGLDRLIKAVRLARAGGADCQLRIIGCTPERLEPELRDVDGVEWLGFIDKQHKPRAYIDSVANNDVGCLLSHAEAGGMCLREFHALGLAVIGPDVGGSPDHVITEAAHLVRPEASDESIAALITRLSVDRVEVQRMREISWARRDEVSWTTAVSRLAEFFSGPCGASPQPASAA